MKIKSQVNYEVKNVFIFIEPMKLSLNRLYILFHLQCVNIIKKSTNDFNCRVCTKEKNVNVSNITCLSKDKYITIK